MGTGWEYSASIHRTRISRRSQYDGTAYDPRSAKLNPAPTLAGPYALGKDGRNLTPRQGLTT